MHIYAERKVKNLYIIFLQNRNGIWQHLLSYKCFIIIAFHHNSYFSPLDTSLHRIISPSDASFPDYYPLTAVIPYSQWYVQYSQKAFSALSNVPFRIMKQHVPCIGKGIHCSPLRKNTDIQRLTFAPYNSRILTQPAVCRLTRHSQ